MKLSLLNFRKRSQTNVIFLSQKKLNVVKVIDISSDCPKVTTQALIKYIRSNKSYLVELCDVYKKGEELGISASFNYQDIGLFNIIKDPVFEFWAYRWGIELNKLVNLIFTNTPEN